MLANEFDKKLLTEAASTSAAAPQAAEAAQQIVAASPGNVGGWADFAHEVCA